MNLIIDQGNSSCKIALFDGGVIIERFKYNTLSIDHLIDLYSSFIIERAIFSSVKAVDQSVVDYLCKSNKMFIQLSHKTPMPVNLGYRTPNTLGCDRIAAIVGAYSEYPNRNILVIDAGTAITFDLLDSSGLFRGGNISPGIDIRLESLHSMTNKLPLVSRLGDTPLIGYDTETAIRSGVIKGISFEIDGYVDTLKSEMSDLLVFLTGGSCKYFEDHIKSTIFADNNIVLKGLNCIIEYNAKL